MNYRETMSRLNAALIKIDSAYEAVAKKHGLTFNALMMVYLMDEAEHVTQKQLCDALRLPKSTVHSILLEFIKQGYATLAVGNNKKEKFIVITAAGQRQFSKVMEETQALENAVLDALGEEACAFLADAAETAGYLLTKQIAKTNDSEVK